MKIFGLKSQVMLLILFGASSPLFAQGTAFTYQGRLNQAGAAVTGLYDFQFAVFDAPSGGSGLGAFPLSATLPVTNGLFTVTLDPGAGVFTGPARWLEIAVRTNGAPTYTNLAPRQPITSAPYAVRSANSALASGVTPGAVTAAGLAPGAVYQVANPSGSISNAIAVDANGLVGIGTTAPQAGLHVTQGTTIISPIVLSVVRDEVGPYTNLAGPNGVAVLGNLLAVGSGADSAVTLIDIADPQSPALLAHIKNGEGGFNKLENVNLLAMKTNLLVVGALSTNVISFFSLTNPSSPVLLAQIEDGVGGWNELRGIYGLAIRDNVLAMAATEDNTVTLADISNPSAPIKRVEIKDGSFGFNSLSGAVSVAISGNLLAIGAFYDHAVTLVDITDPSNPIKLSELRDGVGGFNGLSNVYDVALSANGLLAIAGALDNTVTLVDVSNPSLPVKRAELVHGVNGLDSLLVPTGVAFSGNWLAVASAGDAAITLFDISTPAAPRKLALARDGVAGFDSLASSFDITFAGTNLVVPGNNDNAVTLIGFSTATAGVVIQNRVGIGTAQPRAALDVNGDVIVENATFFDINAEKIELGLRSTASGSNAVAIGNEVVASGRSASALGAFSKASGDYATALGYFTTASGDYSLAGGNNSKAEGDYSVALGGFLTVTGAYAVGIGQNHFVGGDYAVAMGYQNTASGAAAVALGQNNSALGNFSVALGFQTDANANNSMALGSRAQANHEGSFVWADNSVVNQFASTASDQFLIRAAGGVGINTNTTPSVALHVRGNALLHGTVTATNFVGRFTGNGVGLTNLPTQGNYVYVFDTSTQTALAANTYQDVTFDNIGQINGWTRQAGNAIFINNQSGLYLVEYSAHAETTAAGSSTVSLKATLNAVEVAGSQSSVDTDTVNQSLLLSKSFLVNAPAGATLRLQFAGSAISNRLIPNNGLGTTRPSISMTIVRIQ